MGRMPTYTGQAIAISVFLTQRATSINLGRLEKVRCATVLTGERSDPYFSGAMPT